MLVLVLDRDGELLLLLLLVVLELHR